MAMVVAFCAWYAEHPLEPAEVLQRRSHPLQGWELTFVSEPPTTLLEMVKAANFLSLAPMVELTTRAVAAVVVAGGAAAGDFLRWLDEYEPGILACQVDPIVEALTRFAFTHLKDGGVGIDVSEGGRRVTHTRDGGGDWAIGTPALRVGRCVRITVCEAMCDGGITIGVIGTTDPSDGMAGNGFYHDTADGWDGRGDVCLAGQSNLFHGGWPSGGWKTGDTAALALDTATNTLTLKHRRLAQAFTISLSGVTKLMRFKVAVRARSRSLAFAAQSPAPAAALPSSPHTTSPTPVSPPVTRAATAAACEQELREQLKAAGLDKRGKKAELVEHLYEHLYGVAEWFIKVNMHGDSYGHSGGESVEVQPMTTAEYDAFLP